MSLRGIATISCFAIMGVAASVAQGQLRPNILVIWGDDVGVHNTEGA